MIWTSYFAKSGGKSNVISIARPAPSGFRGQTIKELAPSAGLLKKWKRNQILKSQYTIEFNKQLKKLDPNKIGSLCEGKILLCWERSGAFCHRHLVARWLRENGFNVKEL